MRKIIKSLPFSILLFTFSLNGQTLVDVAENTLKVGGLGEEVFYYGFAEGDQMVFSFEEMNGKELKELEIIELPESSKFMDYKTKKIENKKLNITRTGIYKFRLSNSNIKGRICKIKIQRIPSNDETKNFNSSVYWRKAYDTTYTTVKEKYLIKADTAIVNITDQVAKVHSGTNLNGSKTSFHFVLPENTVSWSYYVGVDQAGQEAYQQATQLLAKNASPFLLKIPGYGPLAALALGGSSYIAQLQSGENVNYYIVDPNNFTLYQNGSPFKCYKQGNVINDKSKVEAPLRGILYMCLSNDNAVQGISVTVKITAITVTEQWGVRDKQKMNVASRDEAYLKN
jgi:hypothetical protein